MKEFEYSVCVNVETNEYFFCNAHSTYGLGKNWTICSGSLPMRVVPRESLPDGIVDTIEKYKIIFHKGEKEIPHPRPDIAHLSTSEVYKVLERENKNKED